MLFIMLFSLFSSSGVTYAEMSAPPVLCIQNNLLRIEVSNSAFSSAKVITKIEFLHEKNEVLIRGWHKVAPLHKYNGVFEKKFTELNLSAEQAATMNFFWVDPDGKKTTLSLQLP
jgi:hypothetical protein